jgi:hypothetical protein
MELTMTNNRVPNSGSWKPGQSGNAAVSHPGHATGSRRHSRKTWPKSAPSMAGNTMFVTIKQAPSTFFAIAARLIPADVKVSIEQTFGELSAEDYPILQAIGHGGPCDRLDRRHHYRRDCRLASRAVHEERHGATHEHCARHRRGGGSQRHLERFWDRSRSLSE